MTKFELNKRYADLMGWERVAVVHYDGVPVLEGHMPHQQENEVYCVVPDWTEPNRFFGEVVPEAQRVCGYTFQHKLEIHFVYVGPTVHCRIFRPDANFGKKLLAEEAGKSEGEAGLHATIKALEGMNGKS